MKLKPQNTKSMAYEYFVCCILLALYFFGGCSEIRKCMIFKDVI